MTRETEHWMTIKTLGHQNFAPRESAGPKLCQQFALSLTCLMYFVSLGGSIGAMILRVES